MARLMLSAGICWARQSITALRRRGFEFTSPPPMRAAVTTSRMSLVQARPRAASVAPFLRLIVAHLEWPLMLGGLDYHQRARTKRAAALGGPRQSPICSAK